MRRPRLTMRGLIMGVIALGLAIWVVDAVQVSRKAASYRRRAAYCAEQERRCRYIAARDSEFRARAADPLEIDPMPYYPEWNRKMIPYLESLKLKYQFAAAHPRYPVEPNPPPPEQSPADLIRPSLDE